MAPNDPSGHAMSHRELHNVDVRPGARTITPWQTMTISEVLSIIGSMSSTTAAGDATAITTAVGAVVDSGRSLRSGFGFDIVEQLRGRAAEAATDAAVRAGSDVALQAARALPLGEAVSSSAGALSATEGTREVLIGMQAEVRADPESAPSVRARLGQMMTSMYSSPVLSAAAVLGAPPDDSEFHSLGQNVGQGPSGAGGGRDRSSEDGRRGGPDAAGPPESGPNGDPVRAGQSGVDEPDGLGASEAGHDTVGLNGAGERGSGQSTGLVEQALGAATAGLDGLESVAADPGARDDGSGDASGGGQTTDDGAGFSGPGTALPVGGVGAGGLGGSGANAGGPGLAPPRTPTLPVAPPAPLPAGSSGATPPGTRMPPMMPPMAPAARGPRADDASHRTADYLHHRHNGEDLVGDLPLVGPPVVGDWQAVRDIRSGVGQLSDAQRPDSAELAPHAPHFGGETDQKSRRLPEPEWFSLNLPPTPPAGPARPQDGKSRDETGT